MVSAAGRHQRRLKCLLIRALLPVLLLHLEADKTTLDYADVGRALGAVLDELAGRCLVAADVLAPEEDFAQAKVVDDAFEDRGFSGRHIRLC